MQRFPHGTPVYRTEEVRRIEALAVAQPDPPRLMERAGLAAAALARDLSAGTGKPVVVLAGPGNNGGDALVLARHLKRWWFDVAVMFTGEAEKLSADAAEAFQEWRAAGGEVTSELPRTRDPGLIVDGLFGIGLKRDLTHRYAELVGWINAAHAPVLALDVPSGLESDSGRVLGCAVRASHTMTFIGLKSGLLTLDGPDHAGVLHLATLELDTATLVPPRGSVIGEDVLRGALPQRNLNSHKGSFGSVGIVGGAEGMVGAALLAGRAALKAGAGRVYVGLSDENAPAVDPVQPELMLRPAEEIFGLDHLTCLAAGPGLGVSERSRGLLQAALESNHPLVIDADALNLLAQHGELRSQLTARKAAAILTPHPAEAARLLDVTTGEAQLDRVGSATKLAESYRCSVVLKGAGSICAWPDATWGVNTTGNPGMASAGMGDVLTGILAALIAQGVTPELALSAGVYLHGAAADAAVTAGRGPAGLTATEVIDAARDLVNLSTATARQQDRP